MTATLRFLTLAVVLVGCSAPERSNRAPRCNVQADCADDHICYRGYCVHPDERPADDIDRDEDSSKADGDSAVDAGQPTSPSTKDAQVEPKEPDYIPDAPSVEKDAGRNEPDASEPPPPRDPDPTDAATPPASDASEPPPPVDSGMSSEPPRDAMVDLPTDAGDGFNETEVERDLSVCVLLCSGNQTRCYNCFRRIVMQNPEICTADGVTGLGAIVQNLCGLLCPLPSSCRGGR